MMVCMFSFSAVSVNECWTCIGAYDLSNGFLDVVNFFCNLHHIWEIIMHGLLGEWKQATQNSAQQVGDLQLNCLG